MNVEYINVELSHKCYSFIRTESRFFEVSECKTLDNGPVMDTVPTPASTIADLLAQAEEERQHKVKCKAFSIRELRKEEAV